MLSQFGLAKVGDNRNTDCKDKDGPPRLHRMLDAISNRRTMATMRITRRHVGHLLWRRMRWMRVMLATVWTSRHRRSIVIVVIVLVVVRVQGALVVTPCITIVWYILIMLGRIGIVLSLLACLLALASLHPSLLQQPPLFSQTSSLLPILLFVLTNKGHGLMTENVFIFTKLADPWLTWRIVEICVFLLNATFPRSVLVQLRCTSSRFARWGCLLLRLPILRRRGTRIWCGRI